MNISIFGTGYVGLVSGVCLANTGHFVYCIDNDNNKIEKIKSGIAPIYEPGLANLLVTNKERLFPTTDAKTAIKKSEVIMIAVGTPYNGAKIDLTYIKQAAKEIGLAIKNSNDYKVIVVKSTVIPETTLNVVLPIVLKESGKSIKEVGFCMNPEFLREGKAVEDFTNPDRIVLGVTSGKVEEIMRKVYSGFQDTDILITNPSTAEMIKYTANSYLALTISYANEIARICETVKDVDSETVFRGVTLDKRISPIVNKQRITPQLTTYLRAGCGFGGSCFPKDVKALASFEKEKGINAPLLKGTIEINDSQVLEIFNLGLRNAKEIKKIAVLGTAFKPDTDDIRESPGIKLIELGLSKGFKVNVHDYIALENTKKIFNGGVEYFDDPLETIADTDLIFVTTIWEDYLKYSDGDFRKKMKEDAILIDSRSHFKSRNDQAWRFRVGVGT
jgi:UDPglucose 6-dehydrogenase